MTTSHFLTGESVGSATGRLGASGSGTGDLVRDAFRRRASHAVEQLARSASVEALAEALSAPTDYGAIAWALGSSAIPGAAMALDPLADALARGVGERVRLAGLAGGLLSASEMGRVLGISRQGVDKRRRGNQLLAVRVAGDWRYPAVQAGEDGQVPVGMPAVLERGAARGLVSWAMLDFLLAPDEALGCRAPLDVLREDAGGAALVGRLLEGMGTDSFG